MFTLEARGPMFRIAAVILVGISLGAMGFFLLRKQPEQQAVAPREKPALFADWPKPEVALVLSGQQYGYLQPCGCTRPQYGGLARRFNFLQELRKRGWPLVAVDVGDVAAKTGGTQAMLKYVTSMKALLAMQYAAVGLGSAEVELDLPTVLAEFALNNEKPSILAANLINRDDVDPAQLVKPWTVATVGGGPKVGIVGVVAPSVAKTVETKVRFHPVEKVLPDALRQLAANKVDLIVLLCQGSVDEAKQLAANYPQIHAILTHCREDEPPGQPDYHQHIPIIRIGHKGRYVGVLAAARSQQVGRSFDLRYQLIRLGEEFETPIGQEKTNPVHELLEAYTSEVRGRKVVENYPKSRHPLQVEFPEAAFVGSDRCKGCHKTEHKVWAASAHSHAFDTLVKATRPALRQHDSECVKCHVVGLEYNTGFQGEALTPLLKHVGCESCHGPASLHVKNPNNDKLNTLMNPWRPKDKETPEARKARMLSMDQFCQKCHDIDNDAHWNLEKKWPLIEHPMSR